MKKIAIICIATLVASCSHNPFSKEHHREKHCMKMFHKQDTNNDGVVTKKEMIDSHKAKFNAADTNHDGKVNRTEAKAADWEKEFDMLAEKTKKDALTLKESLKAKEECFKKADTNHDGKVTKEECKAHCMGSKEKAKEKSHH